MPDMTVTYGPGDYFFETGDVSHRVLNKTEKPCTHLLFEILPIDVASPVARPDGIAVIMNAQRPGAGGNAFRQPIAAMQFLELHTGIRAASSG